jgi:acylphosphatase
MNKSHLSIRVYGNVQGVFYRQNTLEKAQALGITGFVRNEPDSSVYLEAEGKPEDLEQLKKWCRKGPEMATVTRIETEEGETKGYSRFEIRH